MAKNAIAAGKEAIIDFENKIPGISNSILIDPNVNHLTETPGRLNF